MKHIEEIQIAGTALLLCGAMFAVSAVAPKGESISKAVTNFTEAPETAAEAQAQAEAAAEDAGFTIYTQESNYDYDNYDIYNQSGEAVQFATVNGTLTVTDIVYGDVNGDGKVNNLDGMVLMRHLAKWPSYPASMISPGADVNADGRINNLDGMILMRHLAKWPAYATLPYSSQKGIVAVQPDNTTFENEPTIVVGNAEAVPGETVRIPIELANNPGVVVMGIMVGYDENLTLLGFEDTGLLPGQLHSTVIENPQPLFWGNTTSGNCTENGVIIYLEFKVADDAAPGTYSITVTYDYENYDIYNYDGEPIEFAIQNGAVTVAAAQPEMHTVTFKDWDGTVLKTQEVQYGGDAEAPADPTRVGYTFTGWDKAFTNITADLVVTAQYEMLGDVDGDGKVTVADAILVARYAISAGELSNEGNALQLADFNCDGFVNIVDATLIARAALGLN